MKSAYTYTILRYVHDVAAGESLNVGVVVHAPALRYAGARIQTNFGRLRGAFPSLDGDSHKDLMRYLQHRFDVLQVRMAEELPYDPQPENAGMIASSILPKDDSSLQWSPLGSGLTDDPGAELTRLYARLVTSNDSPKAGGGRGDDVVWSIYRAPLVQAKVLPHLVPHSIEAENDDVVFEHAWKNHHWHCLQPISFDLLDADNIKAKAHRLLGQMVGVREHMIEDHLYLLVGDPQLEKNKATTEKVLNLLRKDLPVRNDIIREREADAFSREFAEKIERHLAQA